MSATDLPTYNVGQRVLVKSADLLSWKPGKIARLSKNPSNSNFPLWVRIDGYPAAVPRAPKDIKPCD
jgi:hypothetical protein